MRGHVPTPAPGGPPAPPAAILEANLLAVRGAVEAAARRSGRDPRSITILAATKSVAAAVLPLLPPLGVRDFGENRVQEAAAKVRALSDLGARWHMIGRLQTNKVRRALDHFHRFHSVDRDAVLLALAEEAARRGGIVDCLIQVNVSGEPTKGGYAPGEAEAALRRARSLPSLRVTGLMAIPSPAPGGGGRAAFRALRELRDGLRSSEGDLADLSMGMSGDFEEAVEEGATILRLGSALFRGLPPELHGRAAAATGDGEAA